MANGGEKKQGDNEPSDELAHHIRRVSAGLAALKSSGLNERAIVVLVADAAKVGKKNVEKVIKAMGELAKTYCDRA